MPKPEKIAKEIFLAYEISRSLSHRGVKWFCRAPSWETIDREAIETEALRVRDRYDVGYGDGHIIIRHWNEPAVRERYIGTRQESMRLRDLAFDEILEGPDNKTRKFLDLYLSRKTTMTPKLETKQDPVPVGQALEKLPF